MTILEQVRESWSWMGIQPVEIVHENDFGNLILRDIDGRYWRLCPEECYCQVIASDAVQFDTLWLDERFRADWAMQPLLNAALQSVGELLEGRKYCLKIPAAIGGKYEAHNLASAPLAELVGMSGSIAKQVKDLPDGTPIKLRIT